MIPALVTSSGFPCTGCGLCCTGRWRLSGIDSTWPLRDDGACAALVDGRCSIYDRRPNVCRLNHPLSRRTAEAITGLTIDPADYFTLTAAACVALQKEAGLGPEWAPVLEKP